MAPSDEDFEMEGGWRRLDWRMGGGFEGGWVGIGELGFRARRWVGIGIEVNLYFFMHLRVVRSIGTTKYFGMALGRAPSWLGTRDFAYW